MKKQERLAVLLSMAVLAIAVSFPVSVFSAENAKSSVLFSSPVISDSPVAAPAAVPAQEAPVVKKKEFTVQEKAAQSAVKETEDLKNKVRGYIGTGNIPKASEELKGIVVSEKYQDLSGWATLELYKLAEKSGEVVQVTDYLEKAADKNPGNIELKSSVAEGYVRQKNWSKVVDIYEQMCKVRPADTILETRLTNYYMLAGNPQKAIERLEPVVKASPNDTYHSDMLLNAYVKADEQAKALALFRSRIAKEGNSPGLVGRYAQALMDFGMLEESLAQWQIAAAADPRSQIFKNKINEVSGMLDTAKKQ